MSLGFHIRSTVVVAILLCSQFTNVASFHLTILSLINKEPLFKSLSLQIDKVSSVFRTNDFAIPPEISRMTGELIKISSRGAEFHSQIVYPKVDVGLLSDVLNARNEIMGLDFINGDLLILGSAIALSTTIFPITASVDAVEGDIPNNLAIINRYPRCYKI